VGPTRMLSSRLRLRRRIALAATAAIALLAASAGSAQAAPDPKKAIWGPVFVGDQSQFPVYADLGAGIYQYGLPWNLIAPTRPADPTNPADPAYRWPAELDFAIAEAQRYGIRLSITLLWSPGWANGGHLNTWMPNNPRDFADFATAAARRYPSVNLWLIWPEPIISTHIQPFSRKTTPRRYAQILDAAYLALKRVNRANLVIGGNTITEGHIKPLTFIRRLRLPNGKPPRMDLWGHNPFSPRKPNLKKDPVRKGTADTSDLDSLIRWLDTELAEGKRDRKLKIFISEWTIPTDHPSYLFGFFGDQVTVANYLSRALTIAHRMKRVYTLGWWYLYDEAPNAAGNQVNWGLIDANFVKKPAYFAYRDG
jgi:hypothetical protein